MKKTVLLLTVIVVLSIVCAAAVYAYALKPSNAEANGLVSGAAAKGGDAENALEKNYDHDPYTSFAKTASENDLNELKEYASQFKFPDIPEYYHRRIYQLMGLIPENAQRLTLEQAMRISKEIGPWKDGGMEEYEQRFIDAFNDIAKAPDYDGGSGIRTVIYFLNDDGTQNIEISCSYVRYTDAETGSEMYLNDSPNN